MFYAKSAATIKIFFTMVTRICPILALISFVAGPACADRKGNGTFQSFNEAKTILIKEVYRGHQTTFYCGSQYTQGKYVIHTNGYRPRRKTRSARRLEWEHVVRLDSFGPKFSEWRDGHPECVDDRNKPFKGRNCAEKMNAKFRYMQCDLYNIVPVIGEIKALRSNYRFGMVSDEKQAFGECDIEIGHDKIEPPAGVRGDIARIYFYMDWAYPVIDAMGTMDMRLFKTWDTQDPVDIWECERARRIESFQRNENPIVKKACGQQGLW
jgi:deoxyribonuclease-1